MCQPKSRTRRTSYPKPIPRFTIFKIAVQNRRSTTSSVSTLLFAPPHGGSLMSDPIVLSDDEDRIVLDTPLPVPSKKRRTSPESDSNPPVLILDDDPTPQKLGSASTPSFVADTPLSNLPPFVKCSSKKTYFFDDSPVRVSTSEPDFPGIKGVIQLESDNESDSVEKNFLKKDESAGFPLNELEDARYHFSFDMGCHAGEVSFNQGSVSSSCPASLPDPDDAYGYPVDDYSDKDVTMEQNDEGATLKSRKKASTAKKNNTDVANMKTRMSKEEKICAAEEKKQEKIRAAEEKKQKKEQEKLQKATLKAEAAELKKMQQWEKGKFALKSIVAEIDAKVVELGSVGGHLLSRFAEKGISFRIKSNPIERSIIWTLTVPEHISQLYSKPIEVSYIALVYDAEEFCNFLVNGSILDHAKSIRLLYPSHTICYITNRLMAYVNKREQEHYKNPAGSNGWKRPPVEEVLAKLTTHYVRVHSRQCIDEAEVAEHVVGLTSSLASCQFRKRLTRLSVNANGSFVSKDAPDRNIIKNDMWLKALVAIPKVQPRFAIAIRKKYPTMKSLLRVYMDPSKSVHEKEFLLKDLVTEGLIGEDRRLGEVCSKRVYRILMAQSGCIKTDDVEAGADFFRS